MNKNIARNQIKKLLLLDGAGALMLAGASWVALLAARGFSMVEIGFAESIFHVASMIFEVPSGAVADVFGRKKVMVIGRVMSVISSLIMLFSNSFVMVAISMIPCALSYNLASGTREALAFDSLKEAGIEKEYDGFASADMVVYKIASSVATLLAGVALMIGYKRAYAIDVFVGVLCVAIALSLKEIETELFKENSIKKRFAQVAKESFSFMRNNRKARAIICLNAFIGATATLILFFLQAKLPLVGLPQILLGPALFIMGMGAVIGAFVAKHIAGSRFEHVCKIGIMGVLIAIASMFTGNCYLMVIGGMIGSFSDTALCVRSDVHLNTMIPSEQRATLVSINSFTFSIVMIALSPIFGWVISLV